MPSPTPSPALRVAGLWVYPVKSLGGVALREARVGPLGLDGDRRWMLVDAGGRALTQREHAGLARFAVALGAGGRVVVTAPDGASLALDPPPAGGPRRRAEVFGDVVDALAAPAGAGAWFADRLGMPCHLVALPADADRRVDPRYAGPGDRTAFTDGYPVLVATRASLDDLNARLAARGEAGVGVERFRPSVLVDHAAPWEEDGWAGLASEPGGVALALVKPCARCVVTTVDQAAGERRGPEPLRTLGEFRRRGGKVMFAQNAVVRAPGVLRVGDALRAAPASA